jgi:hypothetical protein
VKNAKQKQAPLLANLADINRPLRVRLVRYLNREWWAIAAEDTWPGMVMDLRRLGFEAVALADEVLVREGLPAYEPQMQRIDQTPDDLKSFPVIHPTIRIRRESYGVRYPSPSEVDLVDYDLDEEEYEDDELETVDLDAEE